MASRVAELFARCDNTGRWGPDDERGTLNHITAAKRLTALALVRHGHVVSIGRALPVVNGCQVPPSATLLMTSVGDVAKDTLVISVHGFEVTHLDAVGHNALDGRMYNGRDARLEITREGVGFGSITAAGDGVVTRGILLDVAAARGVSHLPPGTRIGPGDLDAAQLHAGAAVEPGDAVFVRSGREHRLATAGPNSVRRTGTEGEQYREGLDVEAVCWLHDRSVAVYGGDCIEALPSDEPGLPMPLHQLGAAAMGLAILDNPDIECLAASCAVYGRSHFTIIIAPLRIPGGTGSAVNPLVIF